MTIIPDSLGIGTCTCKQAEPLRAKYVPVFKSADGHRFGPYYMIVHEEECKWDKHPTLIEVRALPQTGKSWHNYIHPDTHLRGALHPIKRSMGYKRLLAANKESPHKALHLAAEMLRINARSESPSGSFGYPKWDSEPDFRHERVIPAFTIQGKRLGPYTLVYKRSDSDHAGLYLEDRGSARAYRDGEVCASLHPHACGHSNRLDAYPIQTYLGHLFENGTPKEVLDAGEQLLRDPNDNDAYVRLQHWPDAEPDQVVYVLTVELQPWDYEPTHEMWGVFADHAKAKELLLAGALPWTSHDPLGEETFFHFENNPRPEAGVKCAVPMRAGYATIHKTIVQK